MRRRVKSSDSTASCHSVYDCTKVGSSTPPTSIDDSSNELTPVTINNQLTNLAVQALYHYRADPLCDFSTTTAKLPYKKTPCSTNDVAEVHQVQFLTKSLIEEQGNEPPDHDVNIFRDNAKSKQHVRRSVRLSGKSLEPLLSQNIRGFSNCESQDKINKLSRKRKRKRVSQEPGSKQKANQKIGHKPPKIGVTGLRSRKTFKDLLKKPALSRELRNLSDTNEFAKIDLTPVIHEIWSNGKLLIEDPQKKSRSLEKESDSKALYESAVSIKSNSRNKRKKKWLSKGLYAGQENYYDWYEISTAKKKENSRASTFPGYNKILPLPMWHGKRLIEIGRDFKLPFDVCSPLPPGQPKPNEWRKTTKTAALWKTFKFIDSSLSKCVCEPSIGCDENCQNRIMFYECNDLNCASGPEKCTNRAFAALRKRLKAGGKYRVGVEVIKTPDRGYGVRSNRTFEPHQIIVEYTGEIITEKECDRRMCEEYKDNDCYYLMSFDQSMIVDATKGGIARFVNHSCNPNCRMVKWIVDGNPRISLFAGDEPIMTGDELTYDYHFDPFSSKNIQECRCGSDNCRGVLGSRPRDQKLIKEKQDQKQIGKVSRTRKKRDLKELNGTNDSTNNLSSKKRKSENVSKINDFGYTSNMKILKRTIKSLKKNVSAKIFNINSLNLSKSSMAKTTYHNCLESKVSSNQKFSASEQSLSPNTGSNNILTRYSRNLKSRQYLELSERIPSRRLAKNIRVSKRKKIS